jgi:APA family basic amino acid/polyamine antiporter
LPKVISIGALTAMLGVLLNLILGVSRVVLAMGRRGDIPRAFASVNAAGTTPVPAVVFTTLVIAALALTGSVKLTWSFSALTVLCYYAVTNACALAMPAAQRMFPRWVAWAGLIGCLGLAVWIDARTWLLGGLVIGAGLLWRVIWRRFTPSLNG